MPTRLYLSWNSTDSISSDTDYDAGDVSRTHRYDGIWYDDTQIEEVFVEHQMLDGSVKRDVIGHRLVLSFKLNASIIRSDYDFLRQFLMAKHRWALTKYYDGANEYFRNFRSLDDHTSGWVKANIDGEAHAAAYQDLFESGIVLKSEKIYTAPEKPANIQKDYNGTAKTMSLRWGDPSTASYANWIDRLSGAQQTMFEVWQQKDSGSYAVAATQSARQYDTGALSAGAYKWKVYAYDGRGRSTVSTEVTQTVT